MSRRRLALFWALLLVGLGAGAGTLHWLGAPAQPIQASAEAEPATALETRGDPAPLPDQAAEAGAASRTATPEAAQQVAQQAIQPAGQVAAPPASLAVASPTASGAPVPDPVALPEAAPSAPPPPPLGTTSVAATSNPGGQFGTTASGTIAPGTIAPGAIPAVARAAAADPVIPPPDPEMLERGRHGMVPKLGPDGRTSIRTYARAFDRDADRRPRIGLIIGNFGLFAQHSEEAIARLPGAVTLAFSPYALRPEPLLERARARGMEVLVALPLEPAGFGQDADPGDRALLTSLSAEENLERLDWALSRIQGQVGAIGALGRLRGERFAANTDLLGIIQAALTTRGLLYVDPRPGAPTPARAFGRTVDLVLDDPSETRSEVERRLVELEALARRNGSALGLLGNPTPFFTAAILAWSAGLDQRGGVLVPVTVLLRRPGSQAAQSTPPGSQAAR